jgi:hypothetical protein
VSTSPINDNVNFSIDYSIQTKKWHGTSCGYSKDALLPTNGLRNVVFIHNGILFSHKEE